MSDTKTKIPTSIRQAVEHLGARAIDSVPVDFDFGEGYGETWDYYSAARCDECGAIVSSWDDHLVSLVDVDGNPVLNPETGEPIRAASDEDGDDEWSELIESFDDTPTWEACERDGEDARELNEYGDEPMMNYYYPVDLDDEREAARKLVDSVLTVVDISGTTGVALSGGGMDFSWEICEGFIALGFLPPAHFASLPGMAKTASEKNLTIIAACQRSCELMARRYDGTLGRLDAILDSLRPI